MSLFLKQFSKTVRILTENENNFLDSFNYNIPIYWIWDLLDEFIYQFQTFSQERGAYFAQDDPLKDTPGTQAHSHFTTFEHFKNLHAESLKFLQPG